MAEAGPPESFPESDGQKPEAAEVQRPAASRTNSSALLGTFAGKPFLSRLASNLSIVLALLHVFAPFTILPWAFFKTSVFTFTQKVSFLFSHQLAIRTIPYFRNSTLFGYPVDSWWNFLTHSPHWKACLSYLKLSVESESELAWGDDEERVGNRNILCAMFPHGVLSISHAIAHLSGELGTVGNSDRDGNVSKRAKVVTRLATLQSNFHIPLFRELILSNGVLPVTASAIQAALSVPDTQPTSSDVPTKTCLLLVPGGAAESAFTPSDRPVQMTTEDRSRSSSFTTPPGSQAPIQLLLARRFGFVRLALQSGAALVACFSFGELELYRQPKSSWYNNLADWIKQKTGVRPTIGFGWGGIPFLFPDTSHPVHLVMSRPIPLPKIENPTDAEVKYWHAVFVNELRGVYERNRGRFWGYGEGRELDLVGWEVETAAALANGKIQSTVVEAR
jgi:hypothetical protein